MYPGAEDRFRYTLNPGEGFAESYRVMNERRAGIAEAPWDVVDQIFYPSSAAAAAVEQDVVAPWKGNTTTTLRGSFAARGTSTRSHALATPLDGSFVATLRAPAKTRLALDVIAAGSRVARAVARPASTATARFTVCGQRTTTLRVTRLAGAGTYRLAASRP